MLRASARAWPANGAVEPPLPREAKSYAASACSTLSMPATSSSSVIRKPIVFWMTMPMTQRNDEREGQDGDGADDLAPQLVDAAAVEQAVDAGRGVRGGEEADRERADEPPTRWTPTTSSESS